MNSWSIILKSDYLIIYVIITMLTKNLEIEKKYNLKYIPKNAIIIHKYEIKQYYLIRANKWSNARIRIIDNHKFIQTIKTRETVNQVWVDEKELNVSKTQAKNLLKFFGVEKLKPIKKTRIVLDLGSEYSNLKAEVDIFKWKLKGKKFVEVEFPDPAAMVNFIKPKRFGKELNVTNKDLFKKINKLK